MPKVINDIIRRQRAEVKKVLNSEAKILSLIIPAYNEERSIATALNWILEVPAKLIQART